MSRMPPRLPMFVPNDHYTLAQWIAIEESTGKRYEYHEGVLVSVEAMAGGSFQHAVLAGNIIRVAGGAIVLEESRLPACNMLTSDLRIAVDSMARYLYADAVIVCGKPMYDTKITSAIVNPIVVFEILSPSSEAHDRGEKFDYYSALDALREYVIVSQDRQRVEVRHRVSADTPWRYTVCTMDNENVALPSLGIPLPMAGVYRNWEVEAPQT